MRLVLNGDEVRESFEVPRLPRPAYLILQFIAWKSSMLLLLLLV
jgi:hypothetical protein